MHLLGLVDFPRITSNRSSKYKQLYEYWHQVDEYIENNRKYSFWMKALSIARSIESAWQAEELKNHFRDCEWSWENFGIVLESGNEN